ncbi:hypothetical protein ACLB2K_063807 [Fragaria x ananassa]
MCCRFLLVSLSLASVFTVWRLKEKVDIHEEEGGMFVFQFKEQEEKNRILHGDPWFFNNATLLMPGNDGVGYLRAASLDSLEEDETRLTEVTVAPGFLKGKPTFNVGFNFARRLEPTSFGHGDARCWEYANDALMLVRRLGNRGRDEVSTQENINLKSLLPREILKHLQLTFPIFKFCTYGNAWISTGLQGHWSSGYAARRVTYIV